MKQNSFLCLHTNNYIRSQKYRFFFVCKPIISLFDSHRTMEGRRCGIFRPRRFLRGGESCSRCLGDPYPSLRELFYLLHSILSSFPLHDSCLFIHSLREQSPFIDMTTRVVTLYTYHHASSLPLYTPTKQFPLT